MIGSIAEELPVEVRLRLLQLGNLRGKSSGRKALLSWRLKEEPDLSIVDAQLRLLLLGVLQISDKSASLLSGESEDETDAGMLKVV